MVLKPTKSFLTEAFTNNSFGDRATDFGLKAGLENSYSYLYRLQRTLIPYEEYFYTTRNQIYSYDYDENGNKYYYTEVIRNEYGIKVKKKIPVKYPELGDFYFDDDRRVCMNIGAQLIKYDQRSRYRDPDIGEVDYYGKEITLYEMISNPKIFHQIPVILIDNKVLRDFSVKIYEDHFVLILTTREKTVSKIKENDYYMKATLGWEFIHELVAVNGTRKNEFDEQHQESLYTYHTTVVQMIENTYENELVTKKVYKDNIVGNKYIETGIGTGEFYLYLKNGNNYNIKTEESTSTPVIYTESQAKIGSTLETKQRIGWLDITTNKSQFTDENGKWTLKKSLIRNAKVYGTGNTYEFFDMYTEEDGCYFATVFIGNERLGGTLLDVDVDGDNVIIDCDKKTNNDINLGDTTQITIRFIFYHYLHKHSGFRGKYITTHEKEVNLSDEAWSDIFMIQKEELEDYEMAIPKENMILFRVNKSDYHENDNNDTWYLISNDNTRCFYSNLFQLRNTQETYIRNIDVNSDRYGYYYTEDGKRYTSNDEYVGNEDITKSEYLKLKKEPGKEYEVLTRYKLGSVTPDDKVRVYYFYYPGYDLKYENMYKFFYVYLYCKWGKGSERNLPLDQVINTILFEEMNLENEFPDLDPSLFDDKVTSKEAVIELLDGAFDPDIEDVTKLSSTIYDFFLSDRTTIEWIQQLQDSGIANVYFGDDAVYNEAELLARIIYDFTLVFNFIVLREIYHYHYDDVDYLLNIDNKVKPFAKDMTAIEYKVKRLKDFISDDPEVLRKYVLRQNKVSKKYDFTFSGEDRPAYTLTENTKEKIPESYLFTFERMDLSNYMNYRIFIDGFLYTDYVHEVTDRQDYIYIPKTDLKEGMIVEIETFPIYTFKKEITFSEDIKSVIVEFPEPTTEQSIPTLSDMYFKQPYSDNVFYNVNDFKVEVINENYNYYEDTNQIDVYVPKKDAVFNSYVLVDLDQNTYVPTYINDNTSVTAEGYRTTEDNIKTATDIGKKFVYAKYIASIEKTDETITIDELNKMIEDGLVTLDNDIYRSTKTNRAYKKTSDVSADVYITAGFAYYVEPDTVTSLPKLSVSVDKKIYVNRSTNEYFQEKNDGTFSHFNKYDLLISGESYTEDQINNEFSGYSPKTDKVYKIDFGGGFYTLNGNHYNFKGQRERENDITTDAVLKLINNDSVIRDSGILTNDLLLVTRDTDYVSFSRILDGEIVINPENKGVSHTFLTKFVITLLNEELINNNEDKSITIELGVRKDSILEYASQTYDNYPCIEIGIQNQHLQAEIYEDPDDKSYWKKHTYFRRFYHYRSNGSLIAEDDYINYDAMLEKDKERRASKGVGFTHIIDPGCNEFVRVFRKKNGDGARLRSKNRYELLLNEGALDYGYPRVQMLERILKGEKIIVDVTPYRNRLVYYKEDLIEGADYEKVKDNAIIVDLRYYINKPFDIRYYEVYLNGRRLTRHNIFQISPYVIRLAGIHSLKNLEIYEKDRDWEYYGCDFKDYYLLNDFLLENFMEDTIKEKMIDKISGKVPENHICEDDEDYERDLDIESIFMEIFYYNRLLPLGLADADISTFLHDDIKYNFPIVYELFYRYAPNVVSNTFYEINTSDEFVEASLKYTDMIKDGTYDEILLHERLNGKDIVVYRGTTIFGSKFIDVYTGDNLNSLTRKFVINDSTITEKEENDFRCIYALNTYILTTNNRYGKYFTSNDAETWIPRNAKFKSEDGKKDLTMAIFTPSMLRGEFVFFGAAYDETDAFVSYCTISSYDGLNLHWKYCQTLDSGDFNLTNKAYYSPSLGIVYFENEKYTLNGYDIEKLNVSYLTDLKKDEFVSITAKGVIYEVDGFIYSGKSSNDDKFNYTIFSRDGFKWERMLNTDEVLPEYISNARRLNDALVAVQLVKGDNGNQYNIYIDKDISIENKFTDKFDLTLSQVDELVTCDDNLYVISKDKVYSLYIVKKYIGPKDLNIVPQHVLLLDPDIYFDGDDDSKWNVYMTGNDDEFMDQTKND